MKKIIVKKEYSGKKLIDIICFTFPEVKPSIFLRALNKKNIKVNRKSVKENISLNPFDEISIYISDEEFNSEAVIAINNTPPYEIIFQDPNILIVNKNSGVAVHKGLSTTGLTLIDQINKDFKSNDISLAHRLDMNTGGLLLLAKNKQTLAQIHSAQKGDNIVKRYKCLVKGVPTIGKDVMCHDAKKMKEIVAFLEKQNSRVYIHENNSGKYLHIITRYRILRTIRGVGPSNEDVSELEVELVTGRTHQIRAHLAYLGHPILGDSKYGQNSYNSHFEGNKGKLKTQQLFATSLHFKNVKSMDSIGYLADRSFEISPEYTIKLLN